MDQERDRLLQAQGKDDVSLVEPQLVSSTSKNTPGASDDWETPPNLFARLHAEFHFDLDAAATRQTCKVRNYFGPDHEDPERRDSLLVPWRSRSTFLNPPYGKACRECPDRAWKGKKGGLPEAQWCSNQGHTAIDITHWMIKTYLESRGGCTAVLLTFARTDTRWWHTVAMRAAEIRFIEGRLSFLIDGKPKMPSPAPSCVIILRADSEGPPVMRSMFRE